MNGRIIRPSEKPTCNLSRIGKIKIGMKSEKGIPMSVDYFIPTGKYAALFTKAYGAKPTTIQIVFPSDDAASVCNEYYEYRDNAGKVVARGDGETFEVWNGERYLLIKSADYPNIMQSVKAKYPSKQDWRIRLTMNFFIPLVRGVVGLWTFETNGNASTIPQVRDTFDLMLEQRGFVKGIIFDLNVQYAKSQKPNTNSRYPVVSLVANESENNIAMIKEAYNVKSLNQ